MEVEKQHLRSVFLNPDVIAAGISPTNQEQAAFQAGRLLLAEIKNRTSNGESFGFESTLSGKTYFKFLSEARNKNYKVTVYFLFVNSIKESRKVVTTCPSFYFRKLMKAFAPVAKEVARLRRKAAAE